jgi:hypothetical protein
MVLIAQAFVKGSGCVVMTEALLADGPPLRSLEFKPPPTQNPIEKKTEAPLIQMEIWHICQLKTHDRHDFEHGPHPLSEPCCSCVYTFKIALGPHHRELHEYLRLADVPRPEPHGHRGRVHPQIPCHDRQRRSDWWHKLLNGVLGLARHGMCILGLRSRHHEGRGRAREREALNLKCHRIQNNWATGCLTMRFTRASPPAPCEGVFMIRHVHNIGRVLEKQC